MYGKMIRENLCSRYDINCTLDMKINNLTIKFVLRHDNLTNRYHLQQPRPIIESKMVKHIKYMSHDEQFIKYNSLIYKHELNVF